MTKEKGRVLIVDDEDSVRSLLQRTVEAAGYNTVTADNGQEALNKISQYFVSAAILDIKMPGMSGIELLNKLITDSPDICVVMATAVADAQTAVETLKMGADDYITKPFTQDDVIRALERAFEKRDERRESEQHLQQLEETLSNQAEQLQQQFVTLVETLAREHKLLYKLSEKQRGGVKAFFSKLPSELQEPMSSVEEFSTALLKILKRS